MQDSFLEHPDQPTSLPCFILFSGYLLSRGSNTSCLCLKIISYQTPIYLSELLHLYTSSRQLRSSGDTRAFRIPSSKRNTVVSALSLTNLQLSGTNSLFFVRHFTSVGSFQPFFKTFLFKNLFFSPIALIHDSLSLKALLALAFKLVFNLPSPRP